MGAGWRRWTVRATAVFLVVLLAACGGAGAPSASQPASAAIDGSWELTEGQGPQGPIPVAAEHRITLTVRGAEVGGTAACNSYGGRLVIREGRVRIEELAMTAMGCEPAAMAAESAYTAALTAVTALATEDDALVLSGPGVELRFDPLPVPPTAELVDTAWTLETLIVGDIAAAAGGEEATLELRSDGTFAGSTGCRSFSGRWVERGEQILATTMAMDGRVCPAELEAQDSQVVSVLGDGFVPTIDGQLLTLVDPGSIGLVYRAPDE